MNLSNSEEKSLKNLSLCSKTEKKAMLMLKTVISFVLYELWHLHTTFSASREKAQHKD